MILVLDNYDSFVYNLARHMGLAGWAYEVVRNDAMSVAEIAARKPEAIVISPGPCSPAESGVSIDVVRELGPHIPILGVCLGHQCIGEAYGAKISRATKPVHGKASNIIHDGSDLFADLPSTFQAGRYHSLIVEPAENSPLVITARSEQDEIMAIRHQSYPVYGVQFHPESVLTEHGIDIIRNFTQIALRHNAQRRAA